MTSNPATILVALDIDHVVNVQSSAATATTRVGDLTVSWNPTIPERLRALDERPEIQFAWLSDWCKFPEQLSMFEEALQLGPWPSPHEVFGLPNLTNVVWSKQWWKLKGFQELTHRFGADRAVWIDDNHPEDLDQFPDRWLFGVHPDRGLDHENFDRLEAWISGEYLP